MSRIIIKNLPKATTQQKLLNHIGHEYSITDCSLKYTPDGKFRGFAFIGFKTEEEAQDVINKFNNTFFNTARVKVEICEDLGSERKNRAWSRYSKDSSAYQRQNAEKDGAKTFNSKQQPKLDRKSKRKEEREKKVDELIGELANDPEFQEFLDLHKASTKKKIWDNDVALPSAENSSGKSGANITDDIKLQRDQEAVFSGEEDSDSEYEQPTKKVQKEVVAEKESTNKTAKSKLSDLDYLKSKIAPGGDKALLSDDSDWSDLSEDSEESEESSEEASDSDEGEEEEEEAQNVEKSDEDDDETSEINNQDTNDQQEEDFELTDIQRYIVKMKGLPVTIKESQVKEFFNPIKPKDIKIPRNAKGKKDFCVATVEFATEADQTKAMLRNKNFIGPKRIFLHKSIVTGSLSGETVPDTTIKRPWEQKTLVEERDGAEEDIAESGRLYVRNLAYCCTQQDIEDAFSKFGPLAEVHLPIDKETKRIKGFAFVLFMIPEHAFAAYTAMDGKCFQGRLLHILAARASRDQDKQTAEGSSYKKQQELQKKKQASSFHNWNTLFLGANAVADAMAEKYGTTKSNILDSTSGESLGVRLALGESQLVMETRDFLVDNGVMLDSFSQPAAARSKTVLLAKNLPAGTTEDELRAMLERHGTLARLLLPPSGVTAIAEFLEPTEAKAAFRHLAYTKFKHLPLYLEWAPADVFRTSAMPSSENAKAEDKSTDPDEAKTEKNKEEKEEDDDKPSEPGATLFIKNINFDSNEDTLRKVFEKCGVVKTLTISKKKDLKNPGVMLSMGFGFVEYAKKANADKALRTLQNVSVDGHSLELKVSNRVVNQREGRGGSLKRKQGAGKAGTKILVRNLPFEATANEVRELFSVFGELKFCRLPKKMSGTGSHRGFGFVEFLAKNDAKRAFDTLCHSTHLYGRRLVLEWAGEEDSVEQLRDKTAHYYHQGDPAKKLKKSFLTETLEGKNANKYL